MKFHVSANYRPFEVDEDDDNLTPEVLASRLRKWGFYDVQVEEYDFEVV